MPVSALAAPAAPAAPALKSAPEPTDAELSAILFPTAAAPKAPKPKGPKLEATAPDPDEAEPLDATDAEHDDDDTEPESEDDAGDTTAAAMADAADEDAETEAPAAEGDDAPEAEADDAETDPEAAELAALRGKFTPEQQKAFDKAIGKKVKKNLELRTQLQQRETALQQAQAALAEALEQQPALPITPTAENPLADVESEAALETRLAQARATRRWARAHPNGGTIGEHEVTAEQAAAMAEDADTLLEEHAPKQRQLLQGRAQADAQAVKVYPWLADKTSPGARAVEAELKRHPQLRAMFPAARLMIADLLTMAQWRAQQAATPGAGSKPAAPGAKLPAKAPTTPAGGTRPPKIAGPTKAAGAAVKKLTETGDDPDNAALRNILRS